MQATQSMQKVPKAGMVAFCVPLCLCLLWTGPTGASDADGLGAVESTPQRTVKPDAVPRDSRFTTAHWQKARAYQGAGRYELARQEYLMALAHCRTDVTRDRLQRELQIIELQLRTLR